MKFLPVIAFLFCLHVPMAYAQENILEQFSDGEPILLEDNHKGFNRAMHNVNFFLDGVLVTPVAKFYRRLLPKSARQSVDNFMHNLSEPYSSINNLLQGEPEQAGNNLRRFFVNTALGFGLFDAASDMGHERDKEDFGQTLAVWGVGDGGYIVLPIWGPNTLRSAVGLIPDAFLDPVSIAIEDEASTETLLALQYVEVVNGRADNLDLLTDLKDNSIDFYEALKAVYWQRRLANIKR